MCGPPHIAGGVALNLDVTDRRRLAVAAAFTILALPAIWLFTRGEANSGGGAPGIAAVGVEPPGAAGDPGAPEPIDAMGPNSPIFIDGPSTPPRPDVIQIVVPSPVDGDFALGNATYKSTTADSANSCAAPRAPFGATLTVTNRDNGRVLECVNRGGPGLPGDLAIQLSPAQFSMIAQLIDVPIPVRITWTGSE